MLSFGSAVSLNNLISYVGNNTDKILLGRFCGAEALGIYGRGYQLISIPTQNLNSAVGAVAFTALSRVQNDPERFKNYFIKGYSLVLALTLPITIACALFANDIIFVVLGPKWMDVAIIFQLLSPTVLVFALINPFGWVLVSLGQVRKNLKMVLANTPVKVAGCVIGLAYGPVGVAFGYSAAMLLLVFPVIAWAKHGTIISWGDILQATSPPVVSAIVAAGVAFGVQLMLGGSLSPFLRLALGVGVLSASYLWMLLYGMGQKTIYLDLIRGLRKQPMAEGEK
jgi:O-antigen/teichoic acid export membrane protein